MPLTSGTKIGPYEVASLLGVGGMGEVYRSRDSKLGREVALKVLPSSVGMDTDRLARFSREAKVLAALNHPNIAAIYGLEDSGATHALVMELVEGPTLADRIKVGPIPSDEALPIAKQICEALEFAHERGIVHRDLKPANIKITPEGTVKVLDFGLAKALETETSAVDIGSSPTMSRMATQAGMILGTAAYMSPEQARGKSADRRADIWAFGCVFYEMLTGKMAFGGETVSDTLAAVIKEPPDWSLLPADTSARVRVLVQRCLQKDARQRLQAIGDARIAIDEVLSGAPELTSQLTQKLIVQQEAPAWRRLLPWGIAAILGAVLLFALFDLRQSTHFPSQRPVELTLSIPRDMFLGRTNGPAFAVSPDGSRIAYVTQVSGMNSGRLYVRETDKASAVLLEGAGFAAAPFFSPDSQWIGFFGDGKLKKVSVRGGTPITLCDVTAYRGGSWSDEDTIIFPTDFTSALYRIPASGGTPELLTHLDSKRAEITHRWPQFLPGGKAVLYTASANNNYFGHSTVNATRLDTGETKVLVENAHFGRYLPGGYLAYFAQGTLFVVPFDAKALKLAGTPTPVLQSVDYDLSNGGAQFAVADNGMVIYLTVTGVQTLNLVLLDRKGNSSVVLKDQPDAASPRFSPDGNKIAFEKAVGGAWVTDLTRGTTYPVSVKSGTANFPIWSPDGQRLTYSYTSNSGRAGFGFGERIFRKRADGTGDEEPLTPDGPTSSYASSWSPDGKVLAFMRTSEKDSSCCEVWTLRIDENGKAQDARRFVEGEEGKAQGFMSSAPAFSPDGHWIAYSSTVSGAPQVYVVPFPGPGGKWQVSTDGGLEPRWSKSGHELFYVMGTQLFVIAYSANKDVFQPGKPQVVFQDRFQLRLPYTSYDVTPDGQHFVVLQDSAGGPSDRAEPTVVINWLEEVRRQVAAAQSGSAK
jgi:serine/threonine protein kinase/Tol biopolymer transport system component